MSIKNFLEANDFTTTDDIVFIKTFESGLSIKIDHLYTDSDGRLEFNLFMPNTKNRMICAVFKDEITSLKEIGTDIIATMVDRYYQTYPINE